MTGRVCNIATAVSKPGEDDLRETEDIDDIYNRYGGGGACSRHLGPGGSRNGHAAALRSHQSQRLTFEEKLFWCMSFANHIVEPWLPSYLLGLMDGQTVRY